MEHKHHHAHKPARRLASKAACPHCGSPYNYGQKMTDWQDVQAAYWVTCAGCGATGPKAETQAEALTAWEYRAPPVSLEDAPRPDGWDLTPPDEKAEAKDAGTKPKEAAQAPEPKERAAHGFKLTKAQIEGKEAEGPPK